MIKQNEELAWEALESNHPQKALKIWLDLIQAENRQLEKDNLKSNSCYALLALGQVDQAREIYLELFNKHKTHKYAHQLCMVERESENFDKAIEYLELEKKLIPDSDSLSLSANLYEFGKVNQLLGNHEDSLEYALQSMTEAQKCSDLIMKACAHRLMGDVLSKKDKDKSNEYYLAAKDLFLDAEDEFGANEIDELLNMERR